jgi:hypothetical protein
MYDRIKLLMETHSDEDSESERIGSSEEDQPPALPPPASAATGDLTHIKEEIAESFKKESDKYSSLQSSPKSGKSSDPKESTITEEQMLDTAEDILS